MKTNKGFTLIELLAVIVILAIIALIATPIVLNIIDDTKRESGLRSAEFYLDALELSIAQATLDNKNITDGVYNILENGNICLETYDTTTKLCTDGADSGTDTNELVVEVKGKTPDEGTITIENGQIKGAYTGTMPTWIYQWEGNDSYNNGSAEQKAYWTSSPYTGASVVAWYVNYDSNVGSDSVARYDAFGVRPVVTLKV